MFLGWISMYCDAPGRVQPPTGSPHTVTAISADDAEAELACGDRLAPLAVAEADPPVVTGGGLGGAPPGLELKVTASVTPMTAAAPTAPIVAAIQRVPGRR